MNQEKIIFGTDYSEDELQSFAEANYGRELTDIELNRMSDYIWGDEDVSWARMELMAKAIEAVMKNENGEWNWIDDNYKNNKK